MDLYRKSNFSCCHIAWVIFLFPFLFAGQIVLDRVMVQFPVPTAADLNTGYIDIQNTLNQGDLKIDCSVKQNQEWTLYMAARQPYFYPADLEKPVNHIMWKQANAPTGKYRSVYPYKTPLAVGKGSETIFLDFRMKLNWMDIPAVYMIELDLILETQEIHINKKKLKPTLIEITPH